MPNFTNAVRLELPEAFSDSHFFQAFGERLEIQRIDTRHLTFWDTFEWGVWFGGCLLFSQGKHFQLCRNDDGWIGSEWCGEEIAHAHPRFARDFKAIKGRLTGLLGLRGLAPVLDATFKQRMTELRNESGKIVCRLELTEVFAGKQSKGETFRYCRILPLLGYEAEAAPMEEILSRFGAKQSGDGPLDLLLRNAGTTPRKYTLRPHIALDWEEPARESVGLILRSILAIARSNEQGICSDIDTEFLHDYRICIRKIRSALGLIPGVYPAEETVKIRTILGDLARATNRLRDLDVYLLARKEYLALLPPDFQPALDAMFRDFEHERSGVLQKVAAHLRSASRARLMEELDLFFAEATPHPPSAASELPVGPLVFGRIYKRYRKIRKLTNGLAPDAPDEVMHDLRIQCKKLRYLMEFFAELIPKETAAAMEKPLKQLQNRLGELNDASVQQKFLLDYWKQKPRGGGQTDRALALGGLVSVLHYRQMQHRERIQEALAAFRSEATSDLFKQTFRLIPTEEIPAP